MTITDGTFDILAKSADYKGVIGIWYNDTLRFAFVLVCLAIIAVLAVIGLITVLKWIFFRKPKRKY